MKTNIVRNNAEGMHVYICIDNFDELLIKEEKTSGNIKHSLKLLNSYFIAIRKFAKEKIASHISDFNIEKITGNRMHLYYGKTPGLNLKISDFVEELLLLAAYSHKVIKCLNNDIAKLNSLDDAVISIGADYSHYRAFEFYDPKNNIDEETSIGFAANFACKLQILVNKNELAISKDVYNLLPFGLGSFFEKATDFSLIKYSPTDKGGYYKTKIGVFELYSPAIRERLKFNIDDIKEIANRINFSDMTFSRVRNKLNFNYLSEKDSKLFTGIALFSDIRNFTGKFKDDDSNLKEMSDLTVEAVKKMITNVIEFEGNHIQIQGDKEVAVFPLEYEPENGESIRDAVLCALSIIDELRDLHLEVGIGMSIGDIYASVIDNRSTKSIVILGKTVALGNKLEDYCAKPNELVISNELFNCLQKYEDSKYLTKYFVKRDYYYVTSKSLRDIRLLEEKDNLNDETNKKTYYGVHYIEN